MTVTRQREVASRSDAGFGMVELLIVLVILGILMAITIPTFLSQRRSGYEAQLSADLRNAVILVESGAVADGAYPADQPAFATSDGAITLTYTASADRDAYCVQASHTRLPASRHAAHYVTYGTAGRGVACPVL